MNAKNESDIKALSESLNKLRKQAKAINDASIQPLKNAIEVFQKQINNLGKDSLAKERDARKALSKALTTLINQASILENNKKSIDENISNTKKDLSDSLNALGNQLETLKSALLSLSEIQTRVETMNNESLLSIFSVDIGNRKNNSEESIYQALVYSLSFESDNIQIRKPPEDKRFHNVTFFRQNSSGIYGMFSNVAEWVKKINEENNTAEKPEYEAIGINHYKTEKDSFEVLLFSLYDPSEEKLNKTIEKITKSDNPVGIRLVLTTTINQDDFYYCFLVALFKENSDIRTGSQVISEAIDLQKQYENDRNPKAANNRLRVKRLDLNDSSHTNDPFYNLINSKH